MRPSGRAVALRHAIRPTRIVAVGFLGAIVVGALLLSLPISKAGPGGATWSDALFTAVSAVSITGLTVTDTATYWTGFGHVVIIVLAQLGGLGIMTFATFIGLIVVRKISLSARLSSSTETRTLGMSDAKSIIRGVVLLSFLIEGIIAVVLALQFALAYGMAPLEATWYGVFHAVSAFNNAGFTLFAGGMIEFVSDPVVNIAFATATILGGLGFPVLMQLRKHLWTRACGA